MKTIVSLLLLFVIVAAHANANHLKNYSCLGQEKKLVDTIPTDSLIFTRVEIESMFPGGNPAWAEYVTSNLQYPKKAVKKNIEGTVVVQFIVGRDGKVSNISVFRSVHPLLDEEAMRLIRQSPDWTPAVQNGRKVKSYKRQPITFKLVG